MFRTSIFALIIGLGLMPVSGFTGETRFQVDPRVNLTALAKSGEVVSFVERRGPLFYSDASAVLTVDLDRLAEVSADYGHFVEMRMPNLRESVVIRSEPQRLWIWTRMESFGTSSDHYLDVRILDSLGDSTGARGIEWDLYRVSQFSGPEFNRVDQPAFSRLDGSWYMRPLGNGKIYVRYFLMADLAVSLPDVILSGVVKRQLKEGAKQVVRVLARTASMRQ